METSSWITIKRAKTNITSKRGSLRVGWLQSNKSTRVIKFTKPLCLPLLPLRPSLLFICLWWLFALLFVHLGICFGSFILLVLACFLFVLLLFSIYFFFLVSRFLVLLLHHLIIIIIIIIISCLTEIRVTSGLCHRQIGTSIWKQCTSWRVLGCESQVALTMLGNAGKTRIWGTPLHEENAPSGRLIFMHLTCWEGTAILAMQRQCCIKVLCPKDAQCHTVLALNCQKGSTLPALEVYKNQSPTFLTRITVQP